MTATARRAQTTAPHIRLDKATKGFGTHPLWHELTLDIPPGSILALRGPSGCGKSTLLNCVGLLEPLDSGAIHVDDIPFTRLRPGPARRYRRDHIGYLFQDYALVESATIRANLDIAARPRILSPRADHTQALERFGLADRIDDPVHTLSGGEQQRVALARLLVKPSRLVLADEPTAALDHTNEQIVLDTLTQLADEGRTIILATHHDTVAAIADQTLRL